MFCGELFILKVSIWFFFFIFIVGKKILIVIIWYEKMVFFVCSGIIVLWSGVCRLDFLYLWNIIIKWLIGFYDRFVYKIC